uniref:Uncharacterized protein n=1 Tax=Anopheles atroparvus TaxID=41427 RepID=A0AAG5D2N7_ANOAO
MIKASTVTNAQYSIAHRIFTEAYSKNVTVRVNVARM